jgi:hypothetical protein
MSFCICAVKNELNKLNIFLIFGKKIYFSRMDDKMSLNKQVWQQALKHYREWNDSKFVHHVRSSKRAQAEKWQEYKDLYAFGRLLKPEPSEWEQQVIAREWEDYLNSIQRFEEWRRAHGTKT